MRPKVFGIGFHKTGTKSLKAALERLGYRVTGPNGFRRPDIGQSYREICRRLSPQFDGFQDNPWPLVYDEMDRMWPDAKFVMTRRDPEAWITSVVGHFGGSETPMRELIYGAGDPAGNEATYRRVLRDHEAAVLAHFAGRPGKLLVMDLAAGDGYGALCRFLGMPAPDEPFPHRNRGAEGDTAKG